MYITSIVFTLIAWGLGCFWMQIFISVIRKAFCACGCCCPFWLWDFACCGQLKRISATEISETEHMKPPFDDDFAC